MNEVHQSLVIAFLKSLTLGSVLDDCGNRDDDSLAELAQHIDNKFVAKVIKQRADVAARLLHLICP